MTNALVEAIGNLQGQVEDLWLLAEEQARMIQDYESRLDNTKKMKPFEVRQIRALWEAGNMSQRELADLYQLNTGTVSRIVNRVYYADVA